VSQLKPVGGGGSMELQPELAHSQGRSESEWLVPSAAMTALLGVAAIALMPAAGYSAPPPYFSRFLVWLWWAMFGALVLLVIKVVQMYLAGIEHPVAHLGSWFREKRNRNAAAAAGMMLAGIDMLFFMWIKPEVTAVSPFWADRLFADMDRAIFGRDPWLFFQGIDLTFHAWAYSFFWAVAIAATLLWLFSRPSSKARSASLLNYFALWSIFGPIGQYFGSAAGPIFYQKIGLGDRFAELANNIPDVTNIVSGYLWDMHVNQVAAVGAGISAMPSLHIATAMWIYLAFRAHRSRFAPLTAIFALYMFALSVALGWHYAVDGVIGALGAVVFHWASDRYLEHRAKSVQVAKPAVVVG